MFGHVWHLSLDAVFYEVRLGLTGFPRAVVVYVNGQPALRERRAERRGPYEFKVGTHHARILVSDGSGPGELAYYLTVDGQPAASAAPPAGPVVDMSARAVLVKARSTGAGWLTWIGIFSGINSVLSIGGSTVSFVTGLALTYFIDGVFLAATKSKDVPAVATLVDLVVAGMFVLFGRLASRGAVWPFIAGLVIYVIDAGLFLLLQDIVGFGIHCFALFFVFKGWRAARTLARNPLPRVAPDVSAP
jgi:hypothetical protein